jgi:hypothetical protein
MIGVSAHKCEIEYNVTYECPNTRCYIQEIQLPQIIAVRITGIDFSSFNDPDTSSNLI